MDVALTLTNYRFAVSKSQYFRSYPVVMEEAVKKIESVPGIIELLKKVNNNGEVSIGIDDSGSLEEIAGWNNITRVIIFKPQDILNDSLTLITKIECLVFEICNAFRSNVFGLLQENAKKRILSVEQYVEQTETLEFLSRQQSDRLLLEGIELKYFSSEMKNDITSIHYDKDINYAFQQLGGHSELIAKRYKQLFPSENIIYSGTIGHLSPNNKNRLSALISLFGYYSKNPDTTYISKMTGQFSIIKHSKEQEDLALWQIIEKLFKSKNNWIGNLLQVI